MEISISRSISVSLIRILATLAIVLCHYLQAYDIKWAWVFNVGVQIFLVLSGYLYGHKEISNWRIWFLNRFVKLYMPLYIFTTVFLLITKYFTNDPVSYLNFLKAGGIESLGHLWFMKAIALCYIITPLLQFLRPYGRLVFIVVFIMGLIEYLFLQRSLFLFSWLFLYSIGYFYPSLPRIYQRVVQVLITIIVFSATIKITWVDILNYDGVFNRAWHDMIGIFVCFCLLECIEQFNIHKIPYVLTWIDRHSFYLYITHHPILLGSLSMVPLIPNRCLCVCMTLICILSCTVLLSYVSSIIISRINPYIR